jgi:hypothetical protein
MSQYVYRGDRWTEDHWRGRQCWSVRRADGKCIRGKNGNMLVRFLIGQIGYVDVVVVGRQLRKIA